MASIKNLEKFNRRIIKSIVDLGATPYISDLNHQYSIQTRAGKLDISVHKAEYKSEVFSIFCRFHDEKKANEILTPLNLSDNLNKYSGKWNFHYFTEGDCETLFLHSLKKILL